LSTANR